MCETFSSQSGKDSKVYDRNNDFEKSEKKVGSLLKSLEMYYLSIRRIQWHRCRSSDTQHYH